MYGAKIKNSISKVFSYFFLKRLMKNIKIHFNENWHSQCLRTRITLQRDTLHFIHYAGCQVTNLLLLVKVPF